MLTVQFNVMITCGSLISGTFISKYQKLNYGEE